MTNIKKIIRYLKPYRGMVLLSVILMIVEVASNVLQPKYMEQIVDDGVLQMNIDVVVHAGIMMLVVVLVGGVGAVHEGQRQQLVGKGRVPRGQPPVRPLPPVGEGLEAADLPLGHDGRGGFAVGEAVPGRFAVL